MIASLLIWTTAASLVGYARFCAIAYVAGRRLMRARGDMARSLPSVTILKPCAGADDDLERCLESFLTQDYPDVQIVFGVRHRRDDAYAVIERVRGRHPTRDTAVVVSEDAEHSSPKIAMLASMSRVAKHAVLWLSDSGTQVDPTTLRALVHMLDRPAIGCVASVVVGAGEETFAAALANLHMTAFVGVGTLAGHALTGLAGTGKSVLITRHVLDAIGGWNTLGQYAGDDVVLFQRVREVGLRVALAPHWVIEVCRRGTMSAFVSRHLRWAQIRLRTVPWAAMLEPLLSPVIPAFAWCVITRTRLAALAVAIALAEQAILDSLSLRLLRGRALQLRHSPCLALRPFVLTVLWARAMFPARLDWRGNTLTIGRKSELHRVSKPA